VHFSVDGNGDRSSDADERLPIVAFAHLRWDFVYQRPQHVLSRLAASRRVVVVEEPSVEPGAATSLDVTRPAPGVVRCRPRLGAGAGGFSDEHHLTLAALLVDALRAEGVGDHVAWLYTPMALPLATAFDPALVVYDCMDELSLFHGAPTGLVERESRLLQRADVVFTGGPSLYRAKRHRHPDVHCLPSSVDVAHFRRALESPDEPPDQQAIGGPRFGFFGVIDERFDTALIDRMAAAHPDWQIVLVGPVVKISPASLPRRPNIHYLGQRSYAELPAYLAGWDVCLLPFALNDATRFISPTKTLEYMAAERPIVSTPVRDVADLYHGVVHLAEGPAEFVRACERALAEPIGERIHHMRRIVGRTSWDATVRSMDFAMRHALRRRRAASEGDVECLDTTVSSSAPGQPA
jgi:UDP-galactopyranose mutase